MENIPIDVEEDDLYGHSPYSQLPPPGPRNIIDLPESHSFIVTEVPPDNVMEEDDTPLDSTEAEAPPQHTPITTKDTPHHDDKGNDAPAEHTADKTQESEMDTGAKESQSESPAKEAPPQQMVTDT